MESRLRLNAEQRRQLDVLDLSRPVPVPGRRNLTPRVMAIVLVANDLARRDLPVCTATVRASLVALGECTGDKGNQALGDVLGSWGLDLSRQKRKVLLGGESRMVIAYDVPAGGVSRADLGGEVLHPQGLGLDTVRAGRRRRARPGGKPAPGRYRAGGRGRDQSTPPGSQLGRRALPGAVVKSCAGRAPHRA